MMYNLGEHFKNNNHVNYQRYRKEKILPSFEELRDYAIKYDYIIDRQDPTYISPNDIKVLDIKKNNFYKLLDTLLMEGMKKYLFIKDFLLNMKKN